MIKQRRGAVAGILLAAFLLLARPTAAQEASPPLTIQQVRVQVMPEFDDPRVLVIVQGRLEASEGQLPAVVTFRLPRGAQINQMAVMDVSSGTITSQPYEAVPDPNDERWTLVSYTLPGAHFFYEYYYNPLAGQNDKRFTFVYSSPEAVASLVLEVQQPLAATNFTLDPAPVISRTSNDGYDFTYYQYSGSGLAADGEMAVAVRYTKSEPNPSLTREQVAALMGGSAPQTGGAAAPAAPVAVPAPAVGQPGTAGQVSPWVAVGAGLLALGGLAFFVWRRNRGSAQIASTPAQFCRQCGTALRPGALFCYDCGHLVASVPPDRLAAGHRSHLWPRLAVVAGLLFLGSGIVWAANQGQETAADAPLDRAKMVAGAQVYIAFCAECHGPQAEGLAGPPLNSDGHAHHHADVELRRIISQGQNEMPAWQERLSAQQIDDVLYFIKRQWTPEQRQAQALVRAGQ